ncbi:MAG: carbonic anhydrase [Pseudomonadota bacterium]|nr:carbonic anhydrase [Pseudomonadota bacterium]
MFSRGYFDKKYFSELLDMLSSRYLINDILAGLAVALVAIPLSLAIAMASSVPPGIALISSVVGGFIAAIFGGTTLAITGPAVAMSILISQCISSYGIISLLFMGVICGLLQILFGVFKLGRFTKLIPTPVVSAFITAIGFIIIIGELPKALQLPNLQHSSFIYVITHINHYIQQIELHPLLITLFTIVLIFSLPRIIPISIALLLAVVIPTCMVQIFDISHINLFINSMPPLPTSLPNNITLFNLSTINHLTDLYHLLVSSLAVFFIASLETLLSSNAVDNLVIKKLHNPNQELIGQGIANISVALLGGIPVTGVILRSSINIAAGAKTRRSGIVHSIMIVALVYFFPKFIQLIPISVLASILIVAGLKMLNLKEITRYWKKDKTDLLVYLITFFSIISSDLIDGIQVGLIVALIISAIQLLSTKSSAQIWSNNAVIRVSLSGNMSFWSFETLNRIQDRVLVEQSEIKFVVFEFKEIQGIDNTGARDLIETAALLQNNQIKVIFHGLSEDQKQIINNMTLEEQPPYVLTITENDIKVLLEQDGITHQATDILRHGISKFSERFTQDHKLLMETLAQGQKPHTILITCSDSRLDPNAFFSSSLGELFIVRNVGNVIPRYNPNNKYSEGAAIEFALGALGIQNIVICAHTECGAIKASIQEFNKHAISGLDNWLQIIKDGYHGHPPATADDGCRINLLNQVNHLKTYPIVIELLEEKKLTISAWIYDVHSATILEWDEQQQSFISASSKNMG